MGQDQGQSGGRPIGNPAAMAIAIVVFVIAFAFALFGSVFFRAREEARRSTCRSSLNQIAAHMLLCAGENGGAFPPPDAWNKPILTDRMRGYQDFCPNAPGVGPSYAMNARLKGLKIKDINRPGLTVMLFESDRGNDLSGGPELLPSGPHHKAGHNIAFVDGHVETVPANKVNDLIWGPSGK